VVDEMVEDRETMTRSSHAGIASDGGRVDVGSYLTGYADGEGCFCVSFSKSRRHKFGWEIRPSFSVSQNGNRAEVLDVFRQRFACGSIRPDRSDKTLKYETRCISDLVERVVPHFERHPLLSSKREDFKRFARICRMMQDDKHLTREGFEEIVELASKVNAGKRKFPREAIKL
jgi:hypothetical protein